ncbi:MAG: hypothetical protein ACREQ7_08175, partial [Candidatus Binatia bacterium]
TWNKIWGADLYECPRFAVFLWWVVSFPFRLAVYNQPKYARIKRRLQKILNPLSPPAAAEPVDPPAR